MDFFEAELRYREWKKQYEDGQIDADIFEERINTLTVRGPDSTPWHIGVNTGRWYRLEGGAWVEDNPHPKYAQPPAAVDPPPPPREFAPPVLPQRQAAVKPERKSPILKIGLIALGAFFCLGFLAAGVFIAGLLPELVPTTSPQVHYYNPTVTPALQASAPPSPTESGLPPQQPSPAPQSPVAAALFKDDFSDETSGWQDIRVGEDYNTLYFEGGYLIVVITKGFHAFADPGKDFPGAVRVEVDAVQKTGSPYDEYGLMCRYTTNSDGTASYDYLAISNDGLGLIYRVDHDLKSLLLSEPPGNRSDVIHAGNAVNHLRADCLADGHLALYVNGMEVAAATDAPFTAGGAGLRADSEAGESEVRFDNFEVFQP